MRILFVDPRDSPRRGPWSRQHWDLIVDMGKSSQWSADAWEKQYGCPVIRTDSYRRKIDDVGRVRAMFSAGRGRLIDEEGIDWWEVSCLQFTYDALELLAVRRLASAIPRSAEVWATRRGGVENLLSIVLERPLKIFDDTRLARAWARVSHYAGVARQFSPGQIQEIFFDKYDSGYRWRTRFARRSGACAQPVVLVPSAYTNVSRMAASYARMLPEQQFLMIATRRNAKRFVPPGNVRVRDLAEYADAKLPAAELSSLLERWKKFKDGLGGLPDLHVLSQAGVLDTMPDSIRDGLSVRTAWQEVLRREPICAVFCGDDSNRYTRLPVLLAAKRGIPTVDFHHGALDGLYLLKDLPSDLYMAKNEMERDYLVRICGLPADTVVVVAPAPQYVRSVDEGKKNKGMVVLFSEPYDVTGMRSEEVYREVLPPLCALARKYGREVIFKLHPFESRSERNRLLREILATQDYSLIKIVDGPLTGELMVNAWFGVTVESTTALDCLQNGVACFLCGWLAVSPYEYPQQYARFGVGEVLESVEQIDDIPRRVEEFQNHPANAEALWATADSAMFARWLTSAREQSTTRALS